MHLRAIYRRYMCCTILLTLSILSTLWLDPRQISSSLVWSFFIVFLTGLFIWQSQVLQIAKLIWDNRILVIARTFPDEGRGMAQGLDEMVLSTFGMLSSGQIIEWGQRGLWGIRLKTMEVDPKKMRLSFGNKRQATWFEFEHGIDSKQKILDVVQTLWRETGVKATIQDL